MIDPEHFGEGIGRLIREAIEPLKQQIEQLQQRVKELEELTEGLK